MFGYGPLENSILSRSLDRVKRIIGNVCSLDYNCPKSGLYPLDFALGWPDGLQLLLEAGYKPEGALQLSISVGDIESTRILLEANGFALAKFPAILYIASCSDKSDMHSLIVDSLKKSRTSLRHFALEHFTTYNENFAGLLEEKVLDSRAVEVWN